ncbi:hypothetical protein PFISCL1PPCAC_2073, partial [Pristionchus fissidentatus]
IAVTFRTEGIQVVPVRVVTIVSFIRDNFRFHVLYCYLFFCNVFYLKFVPAYNISASIVAIFKNLSLNCSVST